MKNSNIYNNIKNVSILPSISTQFNSKNSPTETNTTISTTFLTNSSDDINFALNQVKKLKSDLNLSSKSPKKIWEIIPENIYESHGKNNHCILSNIHLKTKDYNKIDPIKRIDWANQRYYSNEQASKIFDSLQILKQSQRKSENKHLYTDLKTFTQQSKEICLNNMFIDLILEEKKKINDEIEEKNYVLQKELKNLNKDIELFDNFKLKINKKNKAIEKQLLKVQNENKKLFEIKRKLNSEHRILLDEMEKTIRNIINMKHYATFTNKILDGKIINEEDENNLKIEIKNNKELELEEYCQTLEKNFENFELKNKEELDVDNFYYMYIIMENKILKNIKIKENYDYEINDIKNEFNNVVEIDLLNKIKLMEDEYQMFLKEKIKLDKEINNINYTKNNYFQYCEELLFDLESSIITSKELNSYKNEFTKNNIFKTITVLTNKINSLENLINFHIDNLNEYEKEDSLLFNDICIKNKKALRYALYLKNIKQERINLENKRKSFENKFKQNFITGRGRDKLPVPPKILELRKKYEKKLLPNTDEEKLENDINNLLYYH